MVVKDFCRSDRRLQLKKNRKKGGEREREKKEKRGWSKQRRLEGGEIKYGRNYRGGHFRGLKHLVWGGVVH